MGYQLNNINVNDNNYRNSNSNTNKFVDNDTCKERNKIRFYWKSFFFRGSKWSSSFLSIHPAIQQNKQPSQILCVSSIQERTCALACVCVCHEHNNVLIKYERVKGFKHTIKPICIHFLTQMYFIFIIFTYWQASVSLSPVILSRRRRGLVLKLCQKRDFCK